MAAGTLTKHSGESRNYLFDFSVQPELVAGQTLTGVPTVTASPTGLTIGPPTLVQPQLVQVQATISGGTAYGVYQVTCTCATSGGATLQCIGSLAVDDG